ncbi:MAG: nitroreductase family protein [Clostridia bacterium]|jgi:nitroreductase|nr:nitroreductase family protein [Clostridia bacterium]MDH7572585.1 nitroreductase family protein [Clostridia bacterium]
MELMEVIGRRRSIRRFRPDPVEEEKLAAVLEAARLAPSWKNGQCWCFVVVRDGETRRKLAEAMPATNPGRGSLVQAPLAVVACVNPAASEEWEGRPYHFVDGAIALEHLVLAAASLGLGTCWLGMIYEDQVRSVLGIPPSVRVLAMTPLGYPDEDPRPRRRKAAEEIAYFERWGGRQG